MNRPSEVQGSFSPVQFFYAWKYNGKIYLYRSVNDQAHRTVRPIVNEKHHCFTKIRIRELAVGHEKHTSSQLIFSSGANGSLRGISALLRVVRVSNPGGRVHHRSSRQNQKNQNADSKR